MSVTDEPQTAFIGAQVPAELKTAVEAIAERDERPVSWVVRHALKQYVQNFGVKAAA